MDQAFDPLNIIILVAAVIIFMKLRASLGTRTGHEKRFDPFNPADTPATRDKSDKSDKSDKKLERDGNVIKLPNGDEPEEAEEREPIWQGHAKEGSPAARGLEAIAAGDSSFEPAAFLDGARIAYEMIITAFNEGDRKQLKTLLAKDVYSSFSAAVDEREKAGHSIDGQFVGIDKTEIVDAGKKGRKAYVTVRFISQIIKATLNQDGEVLDGDPNQIVKVSDVWTFERDMTSGDPNWKLSGTEDIT